MQKKKSASIFRKEVSDLMQAYNRPESLVYTFEKLLSSLEPHH